MKARRLAKKHGLTLHPSLLKQYPLGTPFYCLHHDHGTPVEFLEEPLINRVLFVLNKKRTRELPVRLAAMRLVIGKLPAEPTRAGDACDKARDACVKAGDACVKAGAAYDKARAAYDKARAAYDKAGAAYDKARAAYDKARDAYDKARDAYDKARDAYLPKLLALWKKDYPDHPKWTAKNGLEF